MKKIYQLSFLFIALFFCRTISAQQVIDHGVVGYETRSATVTWAEMQAYDAAHPELRTTRKYLKDAEYSHQQFMNSRGLGNQNNNNNEGNQTVHQIENVQTNSPAPTITFDGEDDNGTLIPPDVSGAVGPNHVLCAHNQDVKIMNKSGTQLSSVTLDAFWSSVGAPSTYDPKEVYDPYSNRYIFTTLGNPATSNSVVLIGVSATND